MSESMSKETHLKDRGVKKDGTGCSVLLFLSPIYLPLVPILTIESLIIGMKPLSKSHHIDISNNKNYEGIQFCNRDVMHHILR